MRDLVLVSGGRPSADDRRVQRFAEWMGVSTRTVGLDGEQGLPGEWLAAGERQGCVAMSLETLGRARQGRARGVERLIGEGRARVLVFGCHDGIRHDATLSWLTGGVIRGVRPGGHGPSVYEFPPRGCAVSRQLAGLSFSTGRNKPRPTFDATWDRGGVDVIMRVDGQAVLVRMAIGSGEVFLLAGEGVVDIDAPLARGEGLEAHYDGVIPLLAVLRYCFGEACWHGPQGTAHLIIDDPLLTERYGFLDYRAFLGSMEREGYRASVAFIPWNHRRTSRGTARALFASHPGLSLCVHGCDHTRAEFDGSDRALLEWKAGVALRRMEQHEARTGLPFARVMVFPQGRFSRAALEAVRATNYLAAVNTSCWPSDGEAGSLTIGDLLRPAVTRFRGVPLFQRRYPRRLVDFALDLFVGKPALMVEHHEYFREGCGKVEEFVAGLRAVEPTLAWPSLSSQLMHSCLMRAADDAVEVEFYTRTFRMENGSGDARRFRLAKSDPDEPAIEAVLVDGVRTPFSCRENRVELELDVDPGESRVVEIVDRTRPVSSARRMGITYGVGVGVRRLLSEFRDNALSECPRFAKAANRLARTLGVTGDDPRGISAN